VIADRSSGRGVFGQPDGTFSVYVSSGDKISISTKGYPIYEFVAKPDSNCQCKVLAHIEKFDDFITLLNRDESFLKTASEMELIAFIKDKFEHISLLR